jgi:tetratricopeptide (TPR) repeat protein/branched-subunit amino acid transport protein
LNLDALKRLVNSHPVLVALGVLTVALLAFYSNSFNADWHYDDYHHVKENINIRRMDNIPSFFTDPTTFSRNPNTRMYRPLLMATHTLNYALAIATTRNGYTQFGYHVVNFAFHLLTAFVIFLILLFLFRRRVVFPGLNPFLPAIFGALFFGLHTINTETVVYISSRSAGMATFFFVLAFFCYVRATDEPGRTSWPVLAAGVVSFALALLTKEISFTLPAMVFFYELLLNRVEGEPLKVRLPRMVLRLLPFAVVAGLYLLVRRIILSEGSLVGAILAVGSTAAAPNFESQISTQIRVWAYYLRELLWPTSLSLDKPFSISVRFFNPGTTLSLVLVTSILAGAGALWRKHPLVTFGALWLFIGLLPESLFRLNIVLNDHRLYLPMVGLVFAATYMAARLYVRFRAEEGVRRPLFTALLAATLLLLGLGTFKRNMVFATEETLWKDVILKDKYAVRGYNNLGIYYEQSGQLDKSIQFYQKTAQLAPLFPNAYINLGNVYHKKKQFDKAVSYMLRAVQLEPDSSLALYNLGNIYREASKEPEAIEAYKKALYYNPRYIEAANNLANIYFKNDQYKEAIDAYKRALDIDPTFGMAYYNLGLAYEGLNNMAQALVNFEQFVRYWDGDRRYIGTAQQKIANIQARMRKR